MSIVRAYFRASTKTQDALRSQEALEAFAAEQGVEITRPYYIENVSGASLQRPKLFQLIEDSKPGDVLLIEQVDRATRLNEADWNTLKARINEKAIKIVSLDLPTSWASLHEADKPKSESETDSERITRAVNNMLLDVLAAVARKDYQDRVRRRDEGIAKARAKGLYKGRPENVERNKWLVELLTRKVAWSTIVKETGCSRSTLARLTAKMNETSAKANP